MAVAAVYDGDFGFVDLLLVDAHIAYVVLC